MYVMSCLWSVVVLLVVTSVRGANHPEVYGEQPAQEDIDNGQCVPIMCQLGVPPVECTRRCALRHYLPVCRPAGFCLCQQLVNGKPELVSPDEVSDQPPEPEIDTPETEVAPRRTLVFHFLAVLFPEQARPSAEPVVVNVHDGRLFWDFRYILTGLFLLMVGLVMYELWMCRRQNLPVEVEPKPPAEVKWKVEV